VADIKLASVIDPPTPEPTFILFAARMSAVIVPVAAMFPTTVPVVIPTRTLVLVKYKLLVSLTSAVVKFNDAAEVVFALILPLASMVIFCPAINADTTRALVKYKLVGLSITFAVYNPFQEFEVIELVTILVTVKFAPCSLENISLPLITRIFAYIIFEYPISLF
jgi:hypothetical protein